MGIFCQLQNSGERHYSRRIQQETGNAQVLLTALKACSRTQNLGRGKLLHAVAVEYGHDSKICIANVLIIMYAKCSSMMDARDVFNSMRRPTVVSWNVLILGYAENGQGRIALDMFTSMRTEGYAPDSVTLLAAVKACTSLAVKEGAYQWEECKVIAKGIHNFAVKNGCNSIYVQNSLVDLYAKCGSMVDAREVFDGMNHRSVVSWTALILGYVDDAQGQIALEMFTKMRTEGPAPNSVTLVAALKACTSLTVSLYGVKAIQNFAVENGCNSDAHLGSTFIDMFAKCGSMVDAHKVFDGMKHPDVVSWTVLILGYVDNDECRNALDIFARMRTEGLAPNSVTLLAAIKACSLLAVLEGASAECMDRGKELHQIAVESCNSDVYVQNSLVDLYAKCGSMSDARKVFDDIKLPGVVSWTALILGYADNGEGHTSLIMFTRMRAESFAPNSVTFGAVFKACGLIGALDFGRKIHKEIEGGNDLDVVLVTCLVDFYAKCGSLVEAQSVFDLHAETRNLLTWNALLAGFSSCGDHEAVFGLFENMQDAGFRPNGITFLCILTCCSHAGLVVKGKECFDAMSTKYDVTPSIKHYTCMIVLFGRADKIDDAMSLLECMPCSPDAVTLETILGACCNLQAKMLDN